MADNHDRNLDTSDNDLESNTGAHTSLYFGQVEGALNCLTTLLILVELQPILMVLIVTMNPV